MSNLQTIKDKIVVTALPELAQQGWNWATIEKATVSAGFQDAMAKAAFPDGLADAVSHFSDIVDRRMMAELDKIPTETMRVRDRIRTAILTRFDVLESMAAQKVAKATLSFWALPVRVFQGQRVLWRSSDRIWIWAGDNTTDYNRYTKRGLLTSLIMGTTLVWLDDKTEDKSITKAFLDRRLENIMEIGRTIGTIGSKISDISKRSRSASA